MGQTRFSAGTGYLRTRPKIQTLSLCNALRERLVGKPTKTFPLFGIFGQCNPIYQECLERNPFSSFRRNQ